MSRYTLEPFDLDNATRMEGGKRRYGYGGGGGGGSSSSAATTSSTTTNTDARKVLDNGALDLSGGGSYHPTYTSNTTTIDGGLVAATTKTLNDAFKQFSTSTQSGAATTANVLNDTFKQFSASAQSGVNDAAITAQAGIASAEKLVGTSIATNANNFTTLLDTARLLSLSAINTQAANTAVSQQLAGSTQAVYSDTATTKTQSTNLMYAAIAIAGIVGFSAMRKT